IGAVTGSCWLNMATRSSWMRCALSFGVIGLLVTAHPFSAMANKLNAKSLRQLCIVSLLLTVVTTDNRFATITVTIELIPFNLVL
ncbi:MAG: hypothetical protein ACRC7Q_08045, partial [Plesiomonas shigelloides]